ncbi:MAG: insulinase family protein, partial [Planctomycetota bacterium]|nr:insulinase family protein [Planctomycetota bacterium]
MPGLAAATLRASLRGTWATGSKNPTAERAALTALDKAWQARMADPTDAAAGAALLEHDRAAAALCDPRAFGRVLAALPAQRPEILQNDGIAVFALTTVAPALPQVAALVVERREQQVLRGLARTWLPALMRRAEDYARRPSRRVEAELLALTMPSSPTIALLEQPPMVAPQRTDALATWAASQHPTRTAHVLYGDLDLDRAARQLARAFATTALPAPPRPNLRTARPLSARRRSVVARAATDSVSLAWVLPAATDPWVADVAARWLGDARSGRLTNALRKKRPQLELRAIGPWPNGASPGLLRID